MAENKAARKVNIGDDAYDMMKIAPSCMQHSSF